MVNCSSLVFASCNSKALRWDAFVRRTFEQAARYNQHRLEEEIQEKDRRLQIIVSELHKQGLADEKKRLNMQK